MTEEQIENDLATPGADQADAENVSEKRERSTIQFPYNDLDDAFKIAKAIHDNAGVECALDQLAGYLKQSITSGAFRVRVSTAATFGLTENERGIVRLTELGRHIADPNEEDAARVKAFLHVPLYARLHDNFKGFTLLPPAALEKLMHGMGVSPKQTNRARQAFMRSAKQAGFFAHGEDRLVRPNVKREPGTKPIEESPAPSDSNKQPGGGGGDEPPKIDPIIQGLFKRLPTAGAVWPKSDRGLWLKILADSFDLVYEENAGSSAQMQTGHEAEEPAE